jgi:uncharacterized damage-inducible protein DinB
VQGTREWIRLSVPHLGLPAALNRACTQEETRDALEVSAARCSEMIEEAPGSKPDRITKFVRDGWAKPWPAGAMMVAYMIAHEAHHRGQVCMLAGQLGFRLSATTARCGGGIRQLLAFRS